MENQEPHAAELLATECAVLHQIPPEIPYQAAAAAVQLKKLVGRTGHARFRRGPAQPPSAQTQETPPAVTPVAALQHGDPARSPQAMIWNSAKPNGSFDSSGGKRSSSLITSGKPPLAPSHKRKCSDRALAEDAMKAAVTRTRRCHCSKKRGTVHLP